MFVCNCNGLRESCVAKALAAGAKTPEAIYQYHGCQAQCGKCRDDMLHFLAASKAAPGLKSAA